MGKEKITPIRKRGLLQLYSGIASNISKKNISVYEIPSGKDDLGYTDLVTSNIFLNFAHSYTHKFNTVELVMFIKGVFSHELLHILITNFPVYMKALSRYKDDKISYKAYANLLNICEDAAIEFFGKQYISKDYINAIKYVREILFYNSPSIDSIPSSYGQFTAALLQFRFKGKLKGRFTDTKTKELFDKALPIFIQCMQTPSQADRVECVDKIFDLCKEILMINKETYDSLKSIEQLNFPLNQGSGNGNDLSDTDAANVDTDMLEEILNGVKKIIDSTGDGDDGKSGDEITDSVDSPYSPTLNKEDMEHIKKDIKSGEKKIKDEKSTEKKKKELDEFNFDFNIPSGFKDICKNARCENTIENKVSDANISCYNAVVVRMRNDIKNLTSQLKRILKNRSEIKEYKTSGKISTSRLYSGRLTSRVFTQRRLPDATDTAVVLAIDISGSMCGQKIRHAREMTIALAEVFAKLDIPLYVFGFTADDRHYDANHRHFLNWSNTQQQRYALSNIKAEYNNFDGYSIRYATELIKHRPETNKLLLVISDGQPSSNIYYNNAVRPMNPETFAIMDTKLAIKEANKVCTPIGILLGNGPHSIHREMYGYNFIHCEQPDKLFANFANLIKKYI